MQIVQLPAAAGRRWVIDGFRLLRRQPLPLLAITFLYLLLLMVTTIVPLVGPFAPMLLTPLLAVGMMHAVRSADQGRVPSPPMLFAGIGEDGGRAWKPLLLLGMVNVFSTLASLACASLADGGTLYGPGGYLFFQLIAPLIMLPFPATASSIAIAGMFVVPLAASFAGLPAGFDRPLYVVMNGAAAMITIFSVVVLDRLTLRNYLSQVEVQRLGELALRNSQRRYQAIFDDAVEGIYRVALDGRFEAANPALAGLLGYESSEALGAARRSVTSCTNPSTPSERPSASRTSRAFTSHQSSRPSRCRIRHSKCRTCPSRSSAARQRATSSGCDQAW